MINAINYNEMTTCKVEKQKTSPVCSQLTALIRFKGRKANHAVLCSTGIHQQGAICAGCTCM